MSVIWEAHGGIRDIVYTDPVPPSLTGTLMITLADNTIVSFDVENGKGITSIVKTGTVGLVDTYTITYNDGTTSTFNVTNGAKGDTGDAWYVWIRYAGEEPTQDSDIGTIPDNWMGIYSGTSSTAPVHYTDYDWFQIKGEKGDTGTAATLVSNNIQYQQSDSGSVVPSGSWSSTIPAPVAGKYLWTRTVLTFNSGSPVTFYSVARYGIDGTGAVSSVNSVSPDGNGNVSLVANDIPTAGGTSVEADLSGVKNTLTQLKTDTFGNINLTGTNNTGSTIRNGTFFYNNGIAVRAITDIQNGSNINIGVNAVLVSDSDGAFNAINDQLSKVVDIPLSDIFTPATGVAFANSSYAKMQNGVIGLHLLGVGSLTLGSDGTKNIGVISSRYRPFFTKQSVAKVNLAVSGQVFGYVSYLVVPSSGNVKIIGNGAGQVLGNETYSWTTNDGTDLTF